VVIRLGQREPAPPKRPPEPAQRFRILQGQQLHLHHISNSSGTVRAWARLHYDSGIDSILYVPDQALVGTRVESVLTASEVAAEDGWVTDAVVEMLTGNVKRGQAWVRLEVAAESGIFGTILCSDYCYSGFGQVALGTYGQMGPGGGQGHLYWEAIKAEGAPGGFSYPLAVSNMIRLVREFIWYYVASADVATRTLRMHLRERGGGLPTGYGTGVRRDLWVSGTGVLTLTASENGSIFGDEARSGVNDNGTITIADAAAAPTPFPLLVPEAGNVDFSGILTNEEALDVDIVWGLFEDWIVI